jgi:hypothetical protein
LAKFKSNYIQLFLVYLYIHHDYANICQDPYGKNNYT